MAQKVVKFINALILIRVVQDDEDSVQLQRIISRCRCQFFYAGYGEVEDDTLPEVPLPVSMLSLGKITYYRSSYLLTHAVDICINN